MIDVNYLTDLLAKDESMQHKIFSHKFLMISFNLKSFQEIEAWMKENEGNEELMREFEQESFTEGATTEEFDSFLRKRAEAVQKQT